MYVEEMVRVICILEEDDTIQKLQTNGGTGRAILYKVSSPRADAGDDVLVNATAGVLQLGTGGFDIVISVKDKVQQMKTKGHIMKARYTSCQHSVTSVDDPEHDDYSIFHSSFHLSRQPVFIAELHSMLPVILGALTLRNKKTKVGVILSDEASLPAGLSDHMRIWKSYSNVFVVTTGQAFGGTEEAVTIPNALQWLVTVKKPDILIISMGPGTTGTGTPFGYSGIGAAQWANITGSLGGQPVWVPRVSFAETRRRHYGISHHTLTTMERFTYAPSVLVLPTLTRSQTDTMESQLLPLRNKKKHSIIYENARGWLKEWKSWSETYPIPIRTMGREVLADEAYILGILAAVKYIFRDKGVVVHYE